MIHVCTSDIEYLVLVLECFLLDGGVLSECQPPRWKHAFYYGMFSSGLIPMGYAYIRSISLVLALFKSWFVPGFVSDLWAASGRS